MKFRDTEHLKSNLQECHLQSIGKIQLDLKLAKCFILKSLDSKSGCDPTAELIRAFYNKGVYEYFSQENILLELDGESLELNYKDFYSFYKRNKSKKKISLKPKKLSGSRNRVAGHNWERECAAMMREVGFSDCVTSRSCSRNRDNDKVDLINAHEGTDWDDIESKDTPRLPLNVQCKVVKGKVDYPKLISELDECNGTKRTNIVFHKSVEKDANGNFQPVGNYAILSLGKFLELYKEYFTLKPDFKLHNKKANEPSGESK